MDNTEIIQAVRKRFEKRLLSDADMQRLRQRAEEGVATMAEADIYARRAAECYNMALHEVLGKASIEEYRDAVDSVIPKGFHQISSRVNDYTKEIIDIQLKDAGIGLKAVSAEYDSRKERDVVEAIRKAAQKAEEISRAEPEADRQVESFAQKAATNTIQTNAKAQNDAGLEVRVTRIYDGIGVHDRKDECQWCLSRCGEDMPYSEAYAKGAFQRHPGCHCELFYKPKRGGWQRQADLTGNQWENATDEQMLKMRQKYGTDERRLSPAERIRTAQEGTLWKKLDGDATVAAGSEASASKLPPKLGHYIPDDKTRQEIIRRGIEAEKPIFADDLLGSLARGLPPDPDKYTVVMHGHPYCVEFFGKKIDVETLCAIIAQRKDYQKGTDIRLISCYTGSRKDGVAQYIANKLGVTVWAPDKLGIINKFAGRYRVYSGSDYGIEDGNFIPFSPNERKEGKQ